MARARKVDADAIVAHIDALPGKLKLDPRREQWSHSVFRFDDIRNAARILQRGSLLSRAKCDAEGLGYVDAADRQVIAQSPEAHRYARLYFRPRTPTQYWMEGVRRQVDIRHQAHCPVPVFLLFDSRRLLTREEAVFSTQNMARAATETGRTARFFKERLDFALIYHDGAIRESEDKDQIVACRQAEVLFEDGVDLDDLREVVCRSGPERDTLLTLLGENAAAWAGVIRLERIGERLFERTQGTFVQDIRLDGDHVMVEMVPHIGPYVVKLEAWDAANRDVLANRARDIAVIRPVYRAPLDRRAERVYLRLKIDDALAYEGLLRQSTVVGPS